MINLENVTREKEEQITSLNTEMEDINQVLRQMFQYFELTFSTMTDISDYF